MHIAEFRTADGIPLMNHTGPLWTVDRSGAGYIVVKAESWRIEMHALADSQGRFNAACYLFAGGASKNAENAYSTRQAAMTAAADRMMSEARTMMLDAAKPA